MCYSYLPETDRVLTLEEYVDFVRCEVNPRDLASIGASASKLMELANNRTFVTEIFNAQLTVGVETLAFYSPQSAILVASQPFSVRLNVWPLVSPNPRQCKIESGIYSYGDAHDHNFTFMTAGYYGPGYETIIYEYDRDKVIGYIGEQVDIRLLEQTSLPLGKVMLYRPFKDIHTQIPPASFSMSINLLISEPENALTQQYYFNIEKGIICDFVESLSTKRVSVLECLRFVGNENSKDLLQHLSRRHPCARTRWAAFETLAAMEPATAEDHWASAARDSDRLVQHAARTRLCASNR
jgi:hypothetical protein